MGVTEKGENSISNLRKKTMKHVLYLILFICVHSVYCYVAAVVEYSPIIFQGNATREEAQQTMLKNLDYYEVKCSLNLIDHQNFIQNAKKDNAQIIVFPEGINYLTSTDRIRWTLWPRFSYKRFHFSISRVYSKCRKCIALPFSFLMFKIPIIPCGDSSFNDRPILQRSSCLAQKYEIILVLNMGDIQPCNQSCPSDGHFQYNTQVAFSETGQLLAKYHKSHLFFEPQFDQPSVPDVVFFDSSFGIRFGMLICFDLMFEYPQGSLLEYGITHFVFSSWWVNFPPVITATQVQQSNSLIKNITILASNSGESWFNSGSGSSVFNKKRLILTKVFM